MSKVLKASVAKEIITKEKAQKFERFMKRQARNSKPVKEVKASAPKEEKMEKVSASIIPANELVIEEISLNNESNFNQEVSMSSFASDFNGDESEDGKEFFGDDQGYSLTSIQEMIEEEETKTYSKGIIRANEKRIVELYGQEVFDRCMSDEEFRTEIASHMKDLGDFSQKAEAPVVIRLQYWNEAAGAWYYTTKKWFNVDQQMTTGSSFSLNDFSIDNTGYSFDDLFDANGELKMVYKNVKDGDTYRLAGGKESVVEEAIYEVASYLGRTLLLSSKEELGNMRVVLSSDRFGRFYGFNYNTQKNEAGFVEQEYAEIEDGIVCILPDSKKEKATSEYLEDSLLQDIQMDVSSRLSGWLAYDLEEGDLHKENSRQDRHYAKKAKTEAAIKEEKRLAFIEENKAIIDLLEKASSNVSLLGVQYGVSIIKNSGEEASKLLNVIYTSKIRVDGRIYHYIKNAAAISKRFTTPTDEKVVFDLKALINDLNSQCESTQTAAINRVISCATMAKGIIEVARSGHYINNREIFFLVNNVATGKTAPKAA